MATNRVDDLASPLRTPIIHITTHDATGKAVVHSSNKEEVAKYPGRQTSHKLVYSSLGLPVDLNDEIDIKQHQDVVASGNLSFAKKNGTICRFVDMEPGNEAVMHRTESLDFGVVLEGKVILQLDDGSETLLVRGDVAVQRGTMHAWKNASDTEWARMFFVLQECKPILVGGEPLKEDLGAVASIINATRNN